MRTTVTIDDDLAVLLDKRRAEENMGFKEALNDALRAGLTQRGAAAPVDQPFEVRPLPLGGGRFESMDNIAETLAVVEGEDHK